MKNKIQSLFKYTLLILIIVIGCSESGDPIPENQLCKVTKINRGDDFNFVLDYNSNSTLKYVEEKYKFSTNTEHFDFKYESGKILVYRSNSNEPNIQPSLRITYLLNSDGLPVEATSTSEKIKFYYSSSKLLTYYTRLVQFNGVQESYDSIATKFDSQNKNIIEATDYYYSTSTKKWTLDYKVLYTYDDKVNPFFNLLYAPTDFYHIEYFSKNNVISEIGSGSGVNYNRIYSYNYNEFSYPVTSSNWKGTTYEYICNK